MDYYYHYYSVLITEHVNLATTKHSHTQLETRTDRWSFVVDVELVICAADGMQWRRRCRVRNASVWGSNMSKPYRLFTRWWLCSTSSSCRRRSSTCTHTHINTYTYTHARTLNMDPDNHQQCLLWLVLKDLKNFSFLFLLSPAPQLTSYGMS